MWSAANHQRWKDAQVRRAAKVDANQEQIVAALRKVGASVTVTSGVGNGFTDLCVGYRGCNYLLECKDGGKRPSERRLTEDQVDWFRLWRGQAVVVESVLEALQAIGAVQRETTC